MSPTRDPKSPTFFSSSAAFARWLATNHAKADELVVGLHKLHAAHRGLTYAQALDEALCWGWIDGVRRAFDADSFTVRFTPRRRGSIWSLVNVRHVQRLEKAGRMRAPGRAAFAARDPKKTGTYSFERPAAAFDASASRAFRANAKAWAFWQAQPPGYRRTATYWVTSAKQEATRERRLAQLVADSAAGRRLRMLASPSRRPPKDA